MGGATGGNPGDSTAFSHRLTGGSEKPNRPFWGKSASIGMNRLRAKWNERGRARSASLPGLHL